MKIEKVLKSFFYVLSCVRPNKHKIPFRTIKNKICLTVGKMRSRLRYRLFSVLVVITASHNHACTVFAIAFLFFCHSRL